MKVSARYLLLCLFIVFAFGNSFAQSRKIDSLRNVLKTEKEDTNKVNTLNILSDVLWRINKHDTSIACATSAQVLAERMGFKKGIAKAYSNIGIVYMIQGDYPKALENDFKSLKIEEELGDKRGQALTTSGIGIIYREQGDYPKALVYNFKALKMAEEIGYKQLQANVTGNIGLVYQNQGDYPKALEYTFKVLKIAEELGNKQIQSDALENIGADYEDQGDYPKALEYDFKAMKMEEESGDKIGLSNTTGNIGAVYYYQGNYPKALEYDFKALKMEEELGDKNGQSGVAINIGGVFAKQKNYKQAKVYLDSGLTLSKKIGANEFIEAAYSGLAKYDSTTGNFKTALEDYKKYIIYRDSLNNEANTKKSVQTEMNFEFEQKQAAEKAEQDKKDAIAEQDRKKQTVIRNSFVAGFVLMLALAFFIFRGYKQKQKANEIITQQKEEVEKQKSLVEHQKQLVEEKNKDILDSITYAKRLQDAILPPLSLVKQYLPESFLLYKPKDIVAGDFYWLERAGDTILLAAADCTGHGVPGALVSVVCSNALNRTVKEFKITEPGKILDKVRELVLETFEKSEDNVQDGMDISLCCINAKTNEAQWSGAYNSLWYIRNKEAIEVPADKQPIGKVDRPLPFNTHSLNLQKGDTLYLFTDGYADQFGGPKGKKFKYKQMQELLLANSGNSMDEQKNVLENTLNEWKGDLEQVDDILVIGIRI